jgi:hypothetical protein
VVGARDGPGHFVGANHERAEDERIARPADRVLLRETAVAPELQEGGHEPVVPLVAGRVMDVEPVGILPGIAEALADPGGRTEDHG